MNPVGKYIEAEFSDLEKIGYRYGRSGIVGVVSDVINEGDRAVIARDIVINVIVIGASILILRNERSG